MSFKPSKQLPAVHLERILRTPVTDSTPLKLMCEGSHLGARDVSLSLGFATRGDNYPMD